MCIHPSTCLAWDCCPAADSGSIEASEGSGDGFFHGLYALNWLGCTANADPERGVMGRGVTLADPRPGVGVAEGAGDPPRDAICASVACSHDTCPQRLLLASTNAR